MDPYYHLESSTYVSYYKTDMLAAERREQLGELRAEPHSHSDERTTLIGPLRLEDVPDTDQQVYQAEAASQSALLASAGVASSSSAQAKGSAGSGAAARKGGGSGPQARPSGTMLRTYRAAVAATAEYTSFHGGSVSQGLAAVVTAMNRVTGIYENELSIRLTLVANNDLLIYTNPSTDPYSNTNPSLLLNQNQANLDLRIGDANYDIGHVFNTGGGGLAAPGVGITGEKALGETGSSTPIGDPFYVDYVAHEIGHQFDADHTWTGTIGSCSRDNYTREPTGAEPGSGSTIMSYAGLCGADNLSLVADPYFHALSFDEIIRYVDDIIPTVGTRTPTGNSIPTASAGIDYAIPVGTPFVLTALGTDGDAADVLTYSWEQLDAGPQKPLSGADNGVSALFRSYPPATTGTRYFPPLANVLANSAALGELLPTTGRTLDFRVTVRDNRAGGGGVNSDDTRIRVINAGGPFRLTAPNTAVHWAAKSQQIVAWNVSGTNGNGINTSQVNIRLSTDGGLTFPILLAAGVPNDGEQLVVIPDMDSTSSARLRIDPVGNVYYDVSDVNFFIDAGLPEDFGDAPEPLYSTTLANDGPRHLTGGPRLGNFADGEVDGQPNAAAGGDGADEDGVAISALVAGQNATLRVASSLADAKLDYFFDFDGNGVFGNDASEVFAATLTAGPQLLTIAVPASAATGATFARFRISTAGNLGPLGLAADGEVEDYAVTIFAVAPPIDYGDAPASYGTLATVVGAAHVVSGPRLGASVDAEADGTPTLMSTGDGLDENGVKFPQLLMPGSNANITVNVSAASILNYFFDFDGSGVFGDQLNESFQATLNSGNNTLSVPIPPSAIAGVFACRFRVSTAGGLSPYGLAADGEVEDYQVRTITIGVITPFENFDSVATPALPAGWTRMSTSSGQPRLWTTVNNAGNSDSPNNHAFVAGADYSSVNTLTSPVFQVTSIGQEIRFYHWYDHEYLWDGAILEMSMNGSSFQNIVSAGGSIISGGYTATINPGTELGTGIAWSGPSSGYYETIVSLPPNANWQNVQLRWKEVTDSTIGGFGWRLDSIRSVRTTLRFDFGDATTGFPTTIAQNGAAHAQESSLILGTLFDTEDNGVANASALGDNRNDLDDEEGVTMVTPMTQAAIAQVAVVASGPGLLQGWIDFNDDRDWTDPGEQIFADQPVTAGVNNLFFPVPATARVTIDIHSRFRLSSQAGLSFNGQAPDGEVEDYIFPIATGNLQPTIGPVSNMTILEDAGLQTVNFGGVTAGGSESQPLLASATSGNQSLIPHPTVTYTSPESTGSLTFAPLANQTGVSNMIITIRDPGLDGIFFNSDDAYRERPFSVTVTAVNDPPSFVVGSNQTVPVNAPAQNISGWATAISAGPSNESAQTVSFQVTGNTNSILFAAPPAIATNGTLTYTPATGAFGVATITVVAQDGGGTANGGTNTSAPQTFTITIGPPPPFQVTTYTPTATGAVLHFNRDVQTSVLNLYDVFPSVFGPADVTLIGATVGNVKGSLVVDPSLRQVTFVKTAGVLVPDTYTLTLRSAANAFQDLFANLLDGDSNGTAGGDYVRTLVVDPPAANEVTLSVGDFARGPAQPVNLPANVATGLPVSFSNGEGITLANFQLRYNPALLTIPHGTGAVVAPGLTNASVTIDTATTPGLAAIQFTSSTPLPAGTTRFIDLLATVPSTAPYLSKHVLDFTNVSLNGGAIPARDDDAVHVVAYFGDTTANGSYSSSDATRIMRLAAAVESGVERYRLLDPLIIADLTGNGGFSGSDTTRIQQVAVGIATPEIPTPLPGVSLTFGGPDPKLSIPTNLRAARGEVVIIPVNIDSIVDLTGNGLESAELIIHYEPTALDVTSVSLGSLVEDRGWQVASRIDPLAGRVLVSLAGLTPLEGEFVGELVRLHASVKTDVPTGVFPINLAATARDVAIRTQLNEGWLTLIPAPTDAANDPGVDGQLTILPPPDALTPQQQRGQYLHDLALMQFVNSWQIGPQTEFTPSTSRGLSLRRR